MAPLPSLRRTAGFAARGHTISAGTVGAFAVASAIGTSTIVFSEPAPTDALMLALIAGLPMLGVTRFGQAAVLNLGLWLVLASLGLAGCAFSANLGAAVTHQAVTLFLAIGAFVLAGYVAADPEPRFRLIMMCYVGASLVAALAALAGYFHIMPSAYDLFTSYGRARGTFKDPNVLGAALVPAIAFLVWIMLRNPLRHAFVAATLSVPLILALLVSFSRGAWVSAALSLVLVVWLALVTTRRAGDIRRLAVVAVLGGAGLIVTIAGALELDAVGALFEERASLDQSYDEGPEGRFGGQAKAIGLILGHPLGIGTHMFRETQHVEEPHNVYLSQFLNAGWIGGLAYIASVFGTLAAGFYALRQRTALQGPLIVATAAFAGLAFEGFVIDSDHWRHFFIVMALVWGLVDGDPPVCNPERRRHD